MIEFCFECLKQKLLNGFLIAVLFLQVLIAVFRGGSCLRGSWWKIKLIESYWKVPFFWSHVILYLLCCERMQTNCLIFREMQASWGISARIALFFPGFFEIFPVFNPAVQQSIPLVAMLQSTLFSCNCGEPWD